MSGERVVVLVQARFGSARLPGKALRPLHGQPMIRHVLARARATGYDVVLATSESGRDDLVAAEAQAAGVQVVRGSEWDVLGRLAIAAQLAAADVVVRVTGDCPLWAPDVGRQVVAAFLAGDQDGIMTNDTTASGYPDGLDVEVFRATLLATAAKKALDRADREHVTPWMRRQGPHRVVLCDEDWARVKISVDTIDDFERVRAVLARVENGDQTWPATRAAIVKWQQEATA